MSGAHDHGGSSGWRGRLLMAACCVPMLVLAVVLVATGVLNVSFLLIAVACTAMMLFMHGGMGHVGHQAESDSKADSKTQRRS